MSSDLERKDQCLKKIISLRFAQKWKRVFEILSVSYIGVQERLINGPNERKWTDKKQQFDFMSRIERNLSAPEHPKWKRYTLI